MSKSLQNFYKSTITLDWSIGTGNFYISTKPTITDGWLVVSPNNVVTREIVRYTNTGTDSNGDYIVVSQRGVGGTTEQIHSVGEPVRMNVTAEYWKDMSDNIDAIVAGDFIPVGAAGEVVQSNGTSWESKKLTQVNSSSSTTSSATPSINTDLYNRHTLTAQAVDITSMSSGLSGVPVDGQKLQIRITPVGRSGGITFINQSNASSALATLTINKPTNTASGDIMFAIVGRNNGATYPSSSPSGWTKLAENDSTNSYSLWYKVASGSEPANYAWTFYTSGLSLYGIILTYRGGFNPINPIQLDSISNTLYVTSNTTVRAASVNVIKQYSPLLFFGFNDSSYTYTKPSVPTTDWVEDYDGSAEGGGGITMEACSMIWSSYGATGDVDATISGTETIKHAFMIALNPELDVTWGASYSGVGDYLPTKIYAPNATNIDLQYNSLTSKWETQGEDKNKSLTYSCGSTTKDISSITTTTIAHGLGKRPKYVKIQGVFNSSGAINTTSTIYATSQVSVYVYGDTGTGTTESSGATFTFMSDTSNYITGKVTCDSTNFNITWVKTGSPTGTANLIWEAEI